MGFRSTLSFLQLYLVVFIPEYMCTLLLFTAGYPATAASIHARWSARGHGESEAVMANTWRLKCARSERHPPLLVSVSHCEEVDVWE